MSPQEILQHSIMRGKWGSANLGTPYVPPPAPVVFIPTPELPPAPPRRHQCKRTMPPRIFRVLEVVGEHLNVLPDQMVSERRTNELAHARHVVMFILKKDYDKTLPQIGRWLGGRDHTTVLHGIRAIEARDDMADTLDTIRGRLH
jgi:hypothetical protein